MNQGYLNSYVKFLKSFMDMRKPLRVVFDCSNGTTGPVLKKLFQNQKLISAELINARPDGNFPSHGSNPLLPGALKQLQRNVLKHRADLGAAFDADGDRVFFVDNYGRKIPSFLIAYLIFIHSQPPFVSEIFTYKSLKYLDLLDAEKLFPSAVGTFFIKEAMKKRKATVGAEYSGHYYFRDFFSCDSGILAALKVMSIVLKMPYTLADFYDFSPGFYTELFNIPIKNTAKALRKIKKRYLKSALKTEKIDGIGFNFKEWFFVVRPSNTEPLLRFFVGAKDKKVLKNRVREIKRIIK